MTKRTKKSKINLVWNLYRCEGCHANGHKTTPLAQSTPTRPCMFCSGTDYTFICMAHDDEPKPLPLNDGKTATWAGNHNPFVF